MLADYRLLGYSLEKFISHLPWVCLGSKGRGDVLFNIREVDSTNRNRLAPIKAFLEAQSLSLPIGIEFMIAVYHGERLVGTGSLVGKILQGIAVEPQFQGEGVSAKIVSSLTEEALRRGRNHLFIFTRSRNSYLFEQLGYKTVAISGENVSLLEWGTGSIKKFKQRLRSYSRDKPEAACVVVNCNPFSLGHKYLIERASAESQWLYVIVVEEDRSLFPFGIRLKLVEEGTEHLKNVKVISGGDYVISSATFPSYFTGEADLARMHASLDIEVFTIHIAPALKINRRYVGKEPYCPVTGLYNSIMKDQLPGSGIELIEISRLENKGVPISASLVRERIRAGDIEGIRELVPKSTMEYLESPRAKGIIQRIVNGSSRH